MFKRATALFAEQEAKDAGERLSAEKLQHIVDSEHGKGMSPTVRLIQRIVKAGHGGFGHTTRHIKVEPKSAS